MTRESANTFDRFPAIFPGVLRVASCIFVCFVEKERENTEETRPLKRFGRPNVEI